jgi:hypothetical protein
MHIIKDGSVANEAHSKLRDIRISLFPRRVIQLLTLVVACLFFLHLVAMYLLYYTGGDGILLRGLVRMFDLLRDINIPTWYSSVNLLISAILLAVIAYAKRAAQDRFTLHWFGLSLIFVLLSIDETAAIHEGIQAALRMGINPGSILYSLAAITATSLFALVVLVIYLKFLANIPRKTMILFLMAGGVFVGGSVGVDYIGELYKNVYGQDNFTFSIMNGIEEVLEMEGIIIFIYALLDHLKDISEETHIRIIRK